MKEKILKGWNLRRIIYLCGGIAVIITGISGRDWLIAAFGAYFIVMGIFAFGCASGNCNPGSCN